MATIRILLADDHAEFRRVLREFLKNLPNIEVVGEAENGKEAVEQTERCLPDVVLMDITMPVQNGIEATRAIKQRWPSTKVLIATNHDDSMYRRYALEAHADGCVMKSDLKPALESLLGSIQARVDVPPVSQKKTIPTSTLTSKPRSTP